jgi:hypothetical protein
MEIGFAYLHLECRCGHRATFPKAWLPVWARNHLGHLRHDAVDRLRCKACGRRGRPQVIICGWAAGRPAPEKPLS